jgi:hypothetical protein
MLLPAEGLHPVTSAAVLAKARDVQIQPVIESKSNGADHDAGAPRVSAWSVILPYLLEHKQFDIRDLLIHAREQGVNTKGAVYTAIGSAQKKGWLERVMAGRYKVLPAIKQAAKENLGKGTKTKSGQAMPQRRDITHMDFILQQLGKGVVTYKAIKQAFITDDRVPRSIDGALGKLKENKIIANSGPGEYKLLAKGQEQLKQL